MPRGDGSGPNGDGPRTGWGYGNCPAPAGETKDKTAEVAATEATPQRPFAGRGMGAGRGFGRRPRGRGMRGGGFRGGNRW